MLNESSSRDPLYACFLTEAPELLHTIEQELLTLKEDRKPDKIYSLMRATHTLKGMVATLGLSPIEQVAHSLESVFNALYEPSILIDAALESLLFQAYECLCLLLTAEWTPGAVNKADLSTQASVIFDQLRERLGDFLDRSPHLPISSELKLDITQSIFETVIEEGLTAVETSLRQSVPSAVATTLREKATIFLGLAEGLDLPGFAAIARTTIAALDANPNHAMTIARIALADFQQGQSLILAGNRARSGTPSTTLKQFATVQLRPQSSTLTPAPSKSQSSELARQPQTGSPNPDSTQTIRVDLERLNRLKYLTGNLLASQTQQDSVKESLRNSLHRFRENFQQHQQTLSKIRENLSRIRNRVNRESPTDITITPLMQSALEESAQLEAALGEFDLVEQQLIQAIEQQQQLVSDLQDDLINVQTVALADVLNRLPATVQRLVATYDKPAELTLVGTEIVIEKAIAQKLYEPLLHLVRNAFDHGLESREVRRQQGKPEVGQICVRAALHGQQIVIEVEDDGEGLNFEQIRQRVVQMELLSSTEAAELTEAQLQEILFEPRFSTRNQVDELSGRGIGLNVVRSQIRSLQGSITVQSRTHQGTTFVLRIPIPTSSHRSSTRFDTEGRTRNPIEASQSPSLEEIWGQIPSPELSSQEPQVFPSETETTLNLNHNASHTLETTGLFIWSTDSIAFILAYNQILEYLSLKSNQIIRSRRQQFLHWRDQMIPVYSLPEQLQKVGVLSTTRHSEQTTDVIIVQFGQQTIALASELKRLMTNSELLIQIDDSAPASCVCGHTRLETGQSVPVIDVATLLNQTMGGQAEMPSSIATWIDRTPEHPPEQSLTRKMSPSIVTDENNVLVVDDSAAMRDLLTLALEEVGYHVLQAHDGQDAIAQLQKFIVQLIVCDIEMPKLNGFEFLRWYLQESSIPKVPVIMLSNWDSNEYRQMALAAGASAYFAKPYNKSTFLAALRSISDASPSN